MLWIDFRDLEPLKTRRIDLKLTFKRKYNNGRTESSCFGFGSVYSGKQLMPFKNMPKVHKKRASESVTSRLPECSPRCQPLFSDWIQNWERFGNWREKAGVRTLVMYQASGPYETRTYIVSRWCRCLRPGYRWGLEKGLRRLSDAPSTDSCLLFIPPSRFLGSRTTCVDMATFS
jgi:hypothetical protein